MTSGEWPRVPLLREDDVLEHVSGPRTAWTTTNAAEAMPGVLTPLGASFWIPACEIGLRAAFHDFGVLPAREVRLPEAVDERLSAMFHGRYAANLDTLRRMADLTPGTDGAAMERQLFGKARADVPKANGLTRLPAVLAKGPVAVVTLPRRLRAVTREMHAWWRAAVTRELGPGEGRTAFAEASRATAFALRTHMTAVMLGQGLFDKVLELTRSAGKEGLELRLLRGFGELEEARLIDMLRAVAAGTLSLDAVLETFGFHGPDIGELSSRSWREDAGPLERMVGTYATLTRTHDAATVRRDAHDAEAELLAALPRSRRGGAKLLLRIARTYNPLREVSKANFLKGMDAARYAARACGRELVAAGQLDTADDVFLLSMVELLERLPRDARERVAARRTRRAQLRGFGLPEHWVGQPTALPLVTSTDDDVRQVTGIPASVGVVEGPARVVGNASELDIVRDGDVLVCPITDPSWAVALGVVSAVVIDVGGPMSHGAIIARELGVPCVIGTRNGTAAIRSGDRVRVDGAAGRVEVLARANGTANGHGAATDSAATDGHGAADAAARSGAAATPRDLPLLRALALKGRGDAEALAWAAGIEMAAAVEGLAAFVEAGWAKPGAAGCVRITPAGGDQVELLLTTERAQLDGAALSALYGPFCLANDELKALVHAWQIRPDGSPNDHADHAYDENAVEGVIALHTRTRPLLEDLVAEAPRLTPYLGRFDHAVQRLRAGEHEWLAKPVADSYHTIWFELHEDLIALQGLSRVEEARAGRAQ